jgi:hypothetical protein
VSGFPGPTIVEGRRARKLRQPKVEHLHDAVARELDVGGFQIAMDDPLLVRRFEGFGDLFGNPKRLVHR